MFFLLLLLSCFSLLKHGILKMLKQLRHSFTLRGTTEAKIPELCFTGGEKEDVRHQELAGALFSGHGRRHVSASLKL